LVSSFLSVDLHLVLDHSRKSQLNDRYLVPSQLLSATEEMPKKYLVHHAIAHHEFRYAELQSISELFNFSITLPEDEEERDPNRPFLIVELEDEMHARYLARRCILVKYAQYARSI